MTDTLTTLQAAEEQALGGVQPSVAHVVRCLRAYRAEVSKLMRCQIPGKGIDSAQVGLLAFKLSEIEMLDILNGEEPMPTHSGDASEYG